MHVEYHTLNAHPIIKKSNEYPREDRNFGDYSSTFITYDGHLCDIVIPENTDLKSNNIPEIRDSVLSSLHIAGKKIQDLLNQNRQFHKFYFSQND